MWNSPLLPGFLQGKFVLSSAPDYAAQPVEVEGVKETLDDFAMVFKSPAKHYAVAAPFDSAITTEGGLVIQYQVQLQEGQECGGAYIKLVNATTKKFKASTIGRDTQYNIMFGPDRCGATDKVSRGW